VTTSTGACCVSGSSRSRRRRLHDRLARVVVSGGGLAIVASILGILLFLVVEVAPLLANAHWREEPVVAAPRVAPLAVLTDDARSHVALLGEDATLRVVRVADGAVVAERRLLPGRVAACATIPGVPGFVAADDAGRAVEARVQFTTSYGPTSATVTATVDDPVELELGRDGAAIHAIAAASHDDVVTVVAALRRPAGGALVVARCSTTENLVTGEKSVEVARRELHAPPTVERLVVDPRGQDVFGATSDGRLVAWDLRDRDATEPEFAAAGGRVTALTLLLGGQALVVGTDDGAIAVWFHVATDSARPQLVRVRDFDPLPSAVALLVPSARDRTFLAQDVGGVAQLCHSTSGRVLLRVPSPLPGATTAAIAPRGNGVLFANAERIVPLALENHHPEAGIGAFFGKVWYEGYREPEHVWQSSSGSEESEPKLGLAPLLFGTLKATLFSLLFAVPLALFAAMYTSQFMHWSLRRFVKPTVEIMASLPSVVLGFLGGLWLAPRLAQFLLVVPLFLAIGPVAVLAAGRVGAALPRRVAHRFPDGFASLVFVVVLAAALALAGTLCRPLEEALFGGDLLGWLRRRLGVAYDSKNCVVLGVSMGVAVVPIVFAIAEDAFSNVPRSLVSGSLALGADRWTTVTRVVLPTASPGLFSAVMIGFGRAVGETMVVVMASGNTPIMDWSAFDGLRSLSANIATEIAEAAQGSTLYRTLFLAALLLFAVTFAVNTAAELVRQRLRARYARL
jgi:phosphate transport system permease protein